MNTNERERNNMTTNTGTSRGLDFEIVEHGIPTPHDILKPHEFDVRDEAGTNQDEVAELKRQLAANDGKHKRNPVRTQDNVVVDGRNSLQADYEHQIERGILKPVTLMDVLGFKWSDLGKREQAQVMLWALGRNMDNKGFRRLATRADKVMVVEQCLRVKPPMTEDEIYDKLPGTNRAEVRKIVKAASDSIVQQKLAYARQNMVESAGKVTPDQALKSAGLSGHYLKALLGNGKKRVKPFSEEKTRLIRDQKIFVSRLQRQAKHNRDLFLEGRFPANQYREMLSIQRGTLLKLTATLRDIEARAEELILKKTPGFHLTQ
jgi:hypothetical protein